MAHRLRLLGIALGLCLSHPAAAARSFTWDAGLALATVSFPAYRGASDRRQLTLPAPTASIDSRDFKLGRGGAKLALNRSSTLRLRLTAGGSLPVDSDDLKIREGMPDLLSSLEAGPALQWHLWSGQHWSITPEWLLRGVVATNFKRFQGIGWTSQPRVSVRWLKASSDQHVNDWSFAIGPVYANRRYHSYYYEVAPEFATADRPAYKASSGFSGWRAKSSMALIRGRLGIYAYLGYDNLEHATFRNSPLVQEHQYWLGGLVFSWRLFGPRTVEF